MDDFLWRQNGTGVRLKARMRITLQIFAFLGSILVCGAFLSPPLYWLGQWATDAVPLAFLARFPFQKYFNRSLLISAIVLLWPFAAWLGVRGVGNSLSMTDARRWRHCLAGFAAGVLAMSALAGIYIAGGFYVTKAGWTPAVFLSALLSCCFVGVLEEWLFRGVIAGLLLKSLARSPSLWVGSAIFAAVHFLKPNPAVRITDVTWTSGWRLVPEMFHQFAHPLLVLGGFGTLLVFGLVLSLAAMRTGSLWLSIGLHAGVVFIKLLFGKGFERRVEWMPWIGPEIQIGVFPVAILLATGAWVWFFTQPRETRPAVDELAGA